MIVGGVILEVTVLHLYYELILRTKRPTRFSWVRYGFLLLVPIISVALIAVREGVVVLNVFVAASLLGAVFEWLIGFFYDTIVGARLWTYHQFGITKYTSLLSLPLWGLAGVLFWLLAQVFS